MSKGWLVFYTVTLMANLYFWIGMGHSFNAFCAGAIGMILVDAVMND